MPTYPPEPQNPSHRYLRPYDFSSNTTVLLNRFIADPSISATAKLVYGALSRVSSGHTYAYPKVESIGKDIGIARRQTIMDALKELVAAGYIESIRRGQGRPNLYRFLMHPTFASLVNQFPDEEPENHEDDNLPDDSPNSKETNEPQGRMDSEPPRTSRSAENALQEVLKPDFQECAFSTSRSAESALQLLTVEGNYRGELKPPPPSSAETAPENRKATAHQAEEEAGPLQPIIDALSPWSAGVATAKKILQLCRRLDPTIPLAAVAAVIAATVPEKTNASAGFFLDQGGIPDTMTSTAYGTISRFWTDSQPWSEKRAEYAAYAHSATAPRALRQASRVLLKLAPMLIADWERQETELTGKETSAAQDAYSEQNEHEQETHRLNQALAKLPKPQHRQLREAAIAGLKAERRYTKISPAVREEEIMRYMRHALKTQQAKQGA